MISDEPGKSGFPESDRELSKAAKEVYFPWLTISLFWLITTDLFDSVEEVIYDLDSFFPINIIPRNTIITII